MHAGLLATAPGQYEPALNTLGTLIGATAYKPAPNGRCDSVWLWGNELWLALEAKSDHQPTGVVSQGDVRQANDQLRLLAGDRGVPVSPPDSATILISPNPASTKTASPALRRTCTSPTRGYCRKSLTTWGPLGRTWSLAVPD